MATSYFTGYLGKQFDRTGAPSRGFRLDNWQTMPCVRSANVNSSVVLYAGQVAHGVSTTTLSGPLKQYPRHVIEPGCGPGHGMPLYLLSSQPDFDVSVQGVPPGTAVYGSTTDPWASVSAMPGYGAPSSVLTAVTASTGIEFETTEYDTAQTYVNGQALRAVTSNTDANAGKVTNQGNAGGVNTFTTGQTLNISPAANSDYVVGFVSGGTYPNADDKTILAYYVALVPGVR